MGWWGGQAGTGTLSPRSEKGENPEQDPVLPINLYMMVQADRTRVEELLRDTSVRKNADSSAVSGGAGTASSTREPKAGADQAWESRAVLRLIEPGSVAECPACGERVKFRARHRDQQVICNVYEDGVWQRVEQFHESCYADAGSPHGDTIST